MLAPARLGLLFVAATVGLAAVPPAGLASCAFSPDRVEDLTAFVERTDGSLFVGTVVDGGRVAERARLEVQEVWLGPDLAEEVWVRTGPEQLPWPASRTMVRRTSVDADPLLGEQYLVGVGDLEQFAVTECSITRFDGEVDAAAPDDVRGPTPDGLVGHRPGLFQTPLGATLVAALLGLVGLRWWGRRLGAAPRGGPKPGPGRAAADGAWRGAVVGLGVAAVAELATAATLALFPTDVGIIGFTLVFGVPLAVVVGALCWWRDRPASLTIRLVLCALPVVLVGVVQVGIQWASQ